MNRMWPTKTVLLFVLAGMAAGGLAGAFAFRWGTRYEFIAKDTFLFRCDRVTGRAWYWFASASRWSPVYEVSPVEESAYKNARK